MPDHDNCNAISHYTKIPYTMYLLMYLIGLLVFVLLFKAIDSFKNI